MIAQIDLAVRFIAIGSALLLLAMLVTGDVRPRLKVTVSGMLLGVIAYILNTVDLFGPLSLPDAMLDLVSLFAPFWIWLFARALFERDPPAGLVGASAVFFVACWYSGNFMPGTRPFGFYGIHAASLVLVADLIRVGLAERGDDLVERRRMIRLWLPVLVGAQAGLILVYETVTGAAIAHPPAQLAASLLIFALTLFAGKVLLRTDPELLVVTQTNQPAPAAGDHMSPQESRLRGALEAAMAARYYRTPGLTITALAEHLEVPEHRLRALINRRLGYRNFSAYLNAHRIGEARAILSDPAQADTAITTIALDLGYNSLATFNRAFRSVAGTTPSEFRAESAGQN